MSIPQPQGIMPLDPETAVKCGAELDKLLEKYDALLVFETINVNGMPDPSRSGFRLYRRPSRIIDPSAH